jgi:alpha-galactosidase
VGAPVSDRAWTASSNGWGPAERDQSNGEQAAGDGVAASTGGVFHPKAIGVHAASTVDLSVAGCERFTASAGIDGEIVNSTASVVFSVIADGVTLYTSPTVTLSSGSVPVDLNITGRSSLRLAVSDAGNGVDYDHATWSSPTLLC